MNGDNSFKGCISSLEKVQQFVLFFITAWNVNNFNIILNTYLFEKGDVSVYVT